MAGHWLGAYNTSLGRRMWSQRFKLASERPKRFQARCEKAELQAYIDQGTERQAQNAAPRIMEQKVLRAGKGQKRAGQFLLKLMSDTLKPS